MTTETSPRRFAHYGAILLAALGMIPGGAHVLEMPPRLLYEAELYMEVTSTMYSLFGSVGAMVQLFAVALAVLLTILVRRTPAFPASLAGTFCLVLSIGVWFVVVGPVNAEWMQALNEDPASAAAAYVRLRPRWEYGHLAAFVIWFAGFAALLYSVFLFRPHTAP